MLFSLAAGSLSASVVWQHQPERCCTATDGLCGQQGRSGPLWAAEERMGGSGMCFRPLVPPCHFPAAAGGGGAQAQRPHRCLPPGYRASTEAAGLPPAGPTPRGVPAAAGEGRDGWPGVACNYRGDAPARGSRRCACTRHPACAAPRRERSDGAGGGPRRQDADAGPGWGSNSGCTRRAASIIEAAGSNPTAITDERAGALRVLRQGGNIIALMCAPGESPQNQHTNARELLREWRPHGGQPSRLRSSVRRFLRCAVGCCRPFAHFRRMKQRMHALQRDCGDVCINGRRF